MRPAEHRELLRALGIVPDEEPDEREEAGPVEFDGVFADPHRHPPIRRPNTVRPSCR